MERCGLELIVVEPQSIKGRLKPFVFQIGPNVFLLIDIDLQLHCQKRLQPVPDKLPLRWQTEIKPLLK